MTGTLRHPLIHGISAAFAAAVLVGCNAQQTGNAHAANPSKVAMSPALIAEGQRVFRFDTFGDEQLWTDILRMHEVVETSSIRLRRSQVGLKVDADVLPPGILGTVDLTTRPPRSQLLKLNAVVGLQAEVDADNHITSLGVTCALCHSTVDDSVAPGIGRRLDGWPNRNLDVGAIIALSPALTADKKAVYNSWGPGKYDPRYNIDGLNTPLVLPPAMAWPRQERDLYRRWPDLVLERLCRRDPDGRAGQFLRPAPGHRRHAHSRPGDAETAGAARLPAQPRRRRGHRRAASTRPRPCVASACSRSNCMGCHVGASGTDNNGGMLHAPAETGMDGAYAARTVNKAYRTTPLRGLWQHPPYFHDGSAATLADVVATTTRACAGPDHGQQQDLVEYLKTL